MASDHPVGHLRRRVVLGTLSCMLAILFGLILFRTRITHDAPSAQPSTKSEPSTSAASQSASSVASSSSAPASSTRAQPLQKAYTLGRPLRVAAAGWDTLAAAILANDGLEPGKESALAAAGIDLRLSAVADIKALEVALARGGQDKDGADIVILALADFVAAYERLRALNPQVFFVTGWSRGREGLWSQRDSLLNLPAKAVVLGSAGADAATFVGLFTLELAGVAPSLVNLNPTDKTPATFFVGDRRAEPPADAGTGKLLLTTADVPRLVPLVAVAQSSLLEKHSELVAAWAKGWLEGERRVQSDAAQAARKIGALQGAPEPLVLVRRLGEIAPASLRDNARMAGLSGRSPVTLDQLLIRTWAIWRGARVLTTPAPEASLVTPSIISALVRSNPELAAPSAPESKPAPRAEGAPILLSYRLAKGKLDDPSIETEIGLVAGVFERSVLRIAVFGPAGVDETRTRKLLQSTADRFELATGKLIAARNVQGDRGGALIEVLSVP